MDEVAGDFSRKWTKLADGLSSNGHLHGAAIPAQPMVLRNRGASWSRTPPAQLIPDRKLRMPHIDELAAHFASLHVPGQPLVLFNVWDAGSAQAVARAGARAIATSSASVAEASGLGEGQEVPLDLAIANAARIARSVGLPVTIDFEGAYATDPDAVGKNAALLAATGAVGCNFEDQVVGTDQLYPIEDQSRRISAFRRAVGSSFFINARTDIFMKSPMDTHDAAMADTALERARAYADAGASGFFVPRLTDVKLLERVCTNSPLPVNFVTFPGCPSNEDAAAAGVARISYGPFPHRDLMKQLEENARSALAR